MMLRKLITVFTDEHQRGHLKWGYSKIIADGICHFWEWISTITITFMQAIKQYNYSQWVTVLALLKHLIIHHLHHFNIKLLKITLWPKIY